MSRILIVTILLGAVLIVFLALHPVGGTHGVEALTSPTTHSHADHQGEHRTAAAVDVANFHSGAITENMTCDAQCAFDRALMGVMCVLLLVLTALIVLARNPAYRYRLIDAVPSVRRPTVVVREHTHLPSLTVLSISRT